MQPHSADCLAELATGRRRSLFADDLAARAAEIEDRLRERRVLVVGGAGSIGAATVEILVQFRPQTLHVVDQNENTLVELVRRLRSSPAGLEVADFHTFPIDFGSSVMQRLLHDQPRYDYVLNFAALKHVRSEKDTCSLLHMLDTNILKPARLLRWLEDRGGVRRYFCVSTDKAANPVNLMGASKRLMEHVAFSGEIAPGAAGEATSARFANVAFSDGSLLFGFLKRLEHRQPLAVPSRTRRFFVSLEEAGQICALAALCGPHRHLLVPRLDPSADLHDLAEIAAAVLRSRGYEPRVYHREEDARRNVECDMAEGCYPMLVTPLNTAGEKPYEEFLSEGDESREIGMTHLLAVPYRPATRGAVASLVSALEEFVSRPETPATKETILPMISTVIAEFHHAASDHHLDGRM